jgi:uncharacterized membrane protein
MTYKAKNDNNQVNMPASRIRIHNHGIGIGSAIAVVLSWHINHSIWWAILHGILSWLYVIYWAICYHA